ncbi:MULTISPECIES: hypothetical protein [Acinetobacter calcoaceticus/baumannii complex]|uniref:hypothetical protein n=1 Tax=Acinetobacter calcoaceticus/baumannii complex TaxID=909768 RepID=UPI0005F99EA7|nr:MULTISPECIES: hypothetical protein [Acinetobacter calcoaceticus/baumannii complex]KAF0597070.1 hypothetical protein AB71190_03976 [Acinetobacter baumannii]KJX72753.1 hypothetical protein WH42_09735 [Acinetobacter baumannii]KQK33501.1 hypothetical protein AQ482_20265 [Acinetobacter baumannii]MBF6755938.1 hypothetical protein [Acinetobacter baumannii]MCT9547261.1 hypothetical protein [Acinetobacter baumannii]
MSKKDRQPKLSEYRNLTSTEQMAIHQMLISYVREENCRFNIIMAGTAEPYNLVKLTSINFENEASAIWVHFETIIGEQIALPIDFLSRIEFSGQQEI